MKTKLLTICLLILIPISIKFFIIDTIDEEIKGYEDAEIVSKGQIIEGNKIGLFFETSTKVDGSYKNVLYDLGIYKNNVRVGTWLACNQSTFTGEILYIYFYNENGKLQGLQWGFSNNSCNTKIVEEFFNLKKSSCSLERDPKYGYKLLIDKEFEIFSVESYIDGKIVPLDFSNYSKKVCDKFLKTSFVQPWEINDSLYKDWVEGTKYFE